MSNTIRIITTLTNNDSLGAPSFGNIPQTQEEIATTSSALKQGTQLVGTTHESIAPGDVADAALCVIRNMHATAIVSVGVEVSAAFHSLVDIPPGEMAKLPRLTSLAGTYLKSTEAATPVVVSLYEIIEPT